MNHERLNGRGRGTVWCRALAISLTVALFGVSLSHPGAARAAAADIPGTPLERSTVSGYIGSTEVDHVYRVVVPDNSLFVASVQGGPGAELGLYLFDGATSSVITGVSLASSALPGAAQRITLVIREGGVFYLNVNGRNLDAFYRYQLIWSASVDVTPPIIRAVTVPLRATPDNVCVTVSASDSVTGVASLTIAQEQPLATDIHVLTYVGPGSYCFASAASSGEVVYSIVATNGVRLSSGPKRFSVTIDGVAPTVIGVVPGAEGYLLAPRAPITITTSERLDCSTVRRMTAFATGGKPIAGVATHNLGCSQITWTPTERIPAGTGVLISILGLRDRAGNALESDSSLLLYRRRSVSLQVESVSTRRDYFVILAKASSKVVGGEIVVEQIINGAWTTVDVASVVQPTFRIRVDGVNRGKVRLRYEGSDINAPTISRAITLD